MVVFVVVVVRVKGCILDCCYVDVSSFFTVVATVGDVPPPPFPHTFVFVVFPPVNSDETRGDEEQVGIGRLEVGEDGDGGGDVALRFFEGRPFQVNVGLLLQMDAASALVDGPRRVHAVLL